MNVIPWELILQIGVWAINAFIQDQAKRAAMTASFKGFIANRQARASQTIELKENADAQGADLDEKQKLQEKKP